MQVDKNSFRKDKNRYIIRKNNPFLKWYYSLVSSRYRSFISLDEMQELVDFVTCWYARVKYPDRDFDYNDGIRNPNFKNIESLVSSLNIEQLLYRLTDNERTLMMCPYRYAGSFHHSIYDKRRKAGLSHDIMINIYHLSCDSSYFVVKVDEKTGKIIPSEVLSNYISFDKDVYIDDLLMVFADKYSDELDFSELVYTIYVHNCDLELRKNILELAALKITYSNYSSIKRGYSRAKKFINEVNEKLNANISLDDFNSAVIRCYTSEDDLELDDKNGVCYHVRRFISNNNK